MDATNPLIFSNQDVIKIEDMDQNQASFIKTSPAKDALSELLEIPNDDSNEMLSGDANSLIVDLNDLLKRDPTLSSLSEDNLAVDISTSTSFADFGMDIPQKTSTSTGNGLLTSTAESADVPPLCTARSADSRLAS